jgi:hypothetical protein
MSLRTLLVKSRYRVGEFVSDATLLKTSVLTARQEFFSR